MSEATLTLFSAPSKYGRVFALVPAMAFTAYCRLMKDDPLWRGEGVQLHWQMPVDPGCRLKPADKLKIWIA